MPHESGAPLFASQCAFAQAENSTATVNVQNFITFKESALRMPDEKTIAIISECLEERYKFLQYQSVYRVTKEKLDIDLCSLKLLPSKAFHTLSDRKENDIASQRKQSRKKLIQEQNHKNSYVSSDKKITRVQDIFAKRLDEEIPRKQSPHRIRIFGKTGSGKTTLCKKIVYEFLIKNEQNYGSNSIETNVSWKNEYKWLIWVPLWHLKNFLSKKMPYNLGDLFRQEFFSSRANSKELANQFWYLISETPENVLFVLDGWDKISDELGSPHIGQLLVDLLNQRNIILTTSSYDNCDKFSFDLELETIGFDKNDMLSYANKVMANNPDDLESIRNLINNDLIENIVTTPIHLDILCCCWKSLIENIKEGQVAITITSLFQEMELKLWSNCLSYPERKERLKSIKGITSSINIEDMTSAEIKVATEPENKYLQRLAFLGWQSKKIFFSLSYLKQIAEEQKDIITKSLIITDIKNSGFISSTPVDDNEICYCFVNICFQEFFAASYLAAAISQNSKIQVLNKNGKYISIPVSTYIAEHKYDPYFENIWGFVTGLLNRDHTSLNRFYTILLDKPYDIFTLNFTLLIIKCLSETNDFEILNKIQELIKLIKKWIVLTLYQYETFRNAHKYLFAYLRNSPNLLFHMEKNEMLTMTFSIALENPKENKSIGVIKALKKIGYVFPEFGISLLCKVIKNKHEMRVKRYALKALPHVAARNLNQILDILIDATKVEDIRDEAIELLTNISSYPTDKVLYSLIHAGVDRFESLSGGNKNSHAFYVYLIQDSLIKYVKEIGNSCVDTLLVILNTSEVAYERYFAMQGLGQFLDDHNSKIISSFYKLLNDENEPIILRTTAVELFEKIWLVNDNYKCLYEFVRPENDNRLRIVAGKYFWYYFSLNSIAGLKKLIEITQIERYTDVKIELINISGKLLNQYSEIILSALKYIYINDNNVEVKIAAVKAMFKIESLETSNDLFESIFLDGLKSDSSKLSVAILTGFKNHKDLIACHKLISKIFLESLINALNNMLDPEILIILIELLSKICNINPDRIIPDLCGFSESIMGVSVRICLLNNLRLIENNKIIMQQYPHQHLNIISSIVAALFDNTKIIRKTAADALSKVNESKNINIYEIIITALNKCLRDSFESSVPMRTTFIRSKNEVNTGNIYDYFELSFQGTDKKGYFYKEAVAKTLLEISKYYPKAASLLFDSININNYDIIFPLLPLHILIQASSFYNVKMYCKHILSALSTSKVPLFRANDMISTYDINDELWIGKIARGNLAKNILYYILSSRIMQIFHIIILIMIISIYSRRIYNIYNDIVDSCNTNEDQYLLGLSILSFIFIASLLFKVLYKIFKTKSIVISNNYKAIFNNQITISSNLELVLSKQLEKMTRNADNKFSKDLKIWSSKYTKDIDLLEKVLKSGNKALLKEKIEEYFDKYGLDAERKVFFSIDDVDKHNSEKNDRLNISDNSSLNQLSEKISDKEEAFTPANDSHDQSDKGDAILSNQNKGSDITNQLIKMNALGSDLNLAEHGHRCYWYSISDGFRLLVAIRKSHLTYIKRNGDCYLFKAPGEEYSYYRENKSGIFISDPYILENISISFIDDIKTITGCHSAEAANKNHHWDNMPNVLILPVLMANHWRVIRIQIDYDAKSVSILWDDPFGREHFSQELKAIILPLLNRGIKLLFTAQMQIESFRLEQFDKSFDQQGKYSNGWDCGPIVMSNICDYIDLNKTNSQFASAEARFKYTIKLARDPGHEDQLVKIREEHRVQYQEIIGIISPMVEKIKLSCELIQLQYSRLKATEQIEGLQEIQNEISNWNAEEISDVFNRLEEVRLNRDNSKRHEPYTEEEFKLVYEFVSFQRKEAEKYRFTKKP